MLKARADTNIPNRDNLISLKMSRYPERLDLLELKLKKAAMYSIYGTDYLSEEELHDVLKCVIMGVD